MLVQPGGIASTRPASIVGGANERGDPMSTEKRVSRLEAHGPAGTGLHEMECDPQDFASDLPTQTLHEYYNDEELGMSVGVWTTSPMQEAFGRYPGDEFVWLLEGGVRCRCRTGRAGRFDRGRPADAGRPPRHRAGSAGSRRGTGPVSDTRQRRRG